MEPKGVLDCLCCVVRWVLAGMFLAPGVLASDRVGERPYEMVWAQRERDDHPPLVDFEDLSGWRVECKDAVAIFAATREQQIWGRFVGKLTHRSTGPLPEIRLVPPQPVPIASDFDAVTLWIYGNNWGYAPDPATPQVGVEAVFEDGAGQEFRVYLYNVDWTEWNLLHRRLTPEQIARVREGGRFKGLRITGGRNAQDRVLYFDNLAVFTEVFAPLTFAPRPRRGIEPLPGQSPGANQGPGRLPFPNRAETILPDNLTTEFKTVVKAENDTFVFAYEGTDGRLTYRLQPKTGTWSDLSVVWSGATNSKTFLEIRPCVDGGVYLHTSKGPMPPERAEALGTKLEGDRVISQWRLAAASDTAKVTYTYRLWKKSLVIDVAAPGGKVAEVRYGRASGVVQPRLVTQPFYPAEEGRPAVVVSGPPDQPLFLTGNTDWYLSNGSILWAQNNTGDGTAVYNGGTRYLAKTDGQRNDCFERFFITVSPRFEEVLPNIPNPVSPWKHITGTRLWRAHGAGDRAADERFWRECRRWGMTRVIVTDHETGWRDGGESFTFRTRPAPKKGGDEGQFRYARVMQDELGFIYGPYNNYTDFAPVNEFWSTDLISRNPDNQLQHAWMRCYAPKPARAVEYCARLAPEIEKKFRFSTAYCDVHTAVAPWHRVDYDPRAPGAGSFAAVFYAFGEIMLLQKEAWQGPVYSEGNYHCFYQGLTDGNYGQDQAYRPAVNPWLVDFDLRKMHDLGCNFGMGNPDMFYASQQPMPANPRERDAWLDRFLAATVAFGHPGFLAYEGGLPSALRSYYLLQQLHRRYCLASATEIRYASAQGELLDTSAVVATGAYRRSQIVTRYSDGTITAVNGHPTEYLKTRAYGRDLDLPPNGFAGWTEDETVEVFSGEQRGRRADYADTPEYLYVDGRGSLARFDRAAGNGIGICRKLPGGQFEVLLHQNADCGFAVEAAQAKALNQAGEVIGPATLRRARGLLYVIPVAGAFSYQLAPQPTVSTPKPVVDLRCDRDEVFAGEVATVRGQNEHVIQIPTNALAGQWLWFEREGGWIDFTVVPLARASLALDQDTLRLELTPNTPAPGTFVVTLNGHSRNLTLAPGKPEVVRWDLGRPVEKSSELLRVEVQHGAARQVIEQGLRSELRLVPILSLPAEWTTGMRLRGAGETNAFGQSGTVVDPRSTSAGGVSKRGLFTHPPYVGGTGYAFAQYAPVNLPNEPKAAFRASVAKGDGSDPGDGILYQLIVIDASGAETVAGEQTVTRHEWKAIEADLSRWAGQRIVFKLITDAGRKNDSTGDWGAWADLRLETLHPMLRRVLDPDPEPYRRTAGPHPVLGVSVEMLRSARSGRLCYEGKGFAGNEGGFKSFAVLNGIELGAMNPANGDETRGIFQTNVSVALTPAAIQSLGRVNRFLLRNPNRDYFSIRRVYLELETADGRKCTSEIATATYSQPPEWAYAEGIGVPFEGEIGIDVVFP